MFEGIYKSIYLTSVLIKLEFVSFILTIALFITAIMATVFSYVEEKDYKLPKRFFVAFLITLAVFLITPNQTAAVRLLQQSMVSMSGAVEGKVLVDKKQFKELLKFRLEHPNNDKSTKRDKGNS